MKKLFLNYPCFSTFIMSYAYRRIFNPKLSPARTRLQRTRPRNAFVTHTTNSSTFTITAPEQLHYLAQGAQANEIPKKMA